MTLYSEGDGLFNSLWEDIGSAQHRIWIESYMWDPDPVGLRTLAELAAAAERGVEVVALVDYFGSYSLSHRHTEPLRVAGGTVIRFNPVWQWPWRWGRRHPLHRDHRKLAVIDDSVAYCGGNNITADYAGRLSGGTGYFRDSHVRVLGPCVEHVRDIFVDSLEEHSKVSVYVYSLKTVITYAATSTTAAIPTTTTATTTSTTSTTTTKKKRNTPHHYKSTHIHSNCTNTGRRSSHCPR